MKNKEMAPLFRMHPGELTFCDVTEGTDTSSVLLSVNDILLQPVFFETLFNVFTNVSSTSVIRKQRVKYYVFLEIQMAF